MAADDGRKVLLAAEGSAGLGLDDSALLGREVEDQLEGVDEVEGALHGAADCYSLFWVVLGDDSVVLNIELLLGSGAVLAFYYVVGGLPDLVGDWLLVLLHEVGLEGVGVLTFAPDDLFFFFGVLDREDGGEFFVGDVDRGDGGGEYGPVGVG